MIEIPIIEEAIRTVLEIAAYPEFAERMKERHGIEVKPILGAFVKRRTKENDSWNHAQAEMALIWVEDAIRYEFVVLPFFATTERLQRTAMRNIEEISRRAIVYANAVKNSLEANSAACL